MTKVYRFNLPITDESTLHDYCKAVLGITIPDTKVCSNHTTPWRAFADAYFARNNVTIWEASRGFGGKSFLLAALGLVEAQTLKCDVNILGGSGQQSTRVHGYMQSFLNRGRIPILSDRSSILIRDPATTTTRLAWGNTIVALTASQTSVRGPHVSRLRMDEVDEMDLKIFDAAQGQTMTLNSVKPQSVFSSTHHNAEGTFTEIKKRAKMKHWPIYEWCYRESMEPHGWLSQVDIEEKRANVTEAMWQAEYELQEPAPGTRAILEDCVEKMFDPERGVFEGADGEYIEVEAPTLEGEYVHGADWAKKQDWTVIVTLRIDCRPWRIVAFERVQRMPWPIMVEKLDKRKQRFGGSAAHDGTGLGDVVAGYLNVEALPVILTGKRRAEIFNKWVISIEALDIVGPRINSMYEEHKFCSVEDLYTTDGHPPDSFVAGALAAYMASNSGFEVIT